MSLRSRVRRVEAAHGYDGGEEEQEIVWATLLASAECYEATGCLKATAPGIHLCQERDLAAAWELLAHFHPKMFGSLALR